MTGDRKVVWIALGMDSVARNYLRACVWVSVLCCLSLHLLYSFCLSLPGFSWCLCYEPERNDCFCLLGRGNTGLLRFSGDPALLLTAVMMVLVVTFGMRTALFGGWCWVLEQSCSCIHGWSAWESLPECSSLQTVNCVPGVAEMCSCWDCLLPGRALGNWGWASVALACFWPAICWAQASLWSIF